MIKQLFDKIFKYEEKTEYEFILPNTANNIKEDSFNNDENETVSKKLEDNKEFLKIKYNMLINSDIKLREFTISVQSKKIPAFLLYIDGMVSDDNINDFVLQPLLLKNSIKMRENPTKPTNKNQKVFTRFNLENFIYSSLIPQNSVNKQKEFKKIIANVNVIGNKGI